ncbi:MAG TPA: hypothetical protein VLE27_15425 [Thermoanaerobaculia bacterium]|nr:hypothetical protein [Thermoanaerobaculia bacterium]
MRKASLLMFLLAVLVLPAVAVAEEYHLLLQPADEQNAAPATVPCNTEPNTEPSLAAIFSPIQQADMKATYTASSAGACCEIAGCCIHAQSGCEQCSGGRRWFSIYNCANYPGAICKIYSATCPSPC